MRRIFAAIGLALFLQGSAYAFTLHSEGLMGWDAKTLIFKTNPQDCGISEGKFNEAIDTAVDLWNSVSTSAIVLKREGRTDSSSALFGLFYENTGEFLITDSPLVFCTPNYDKDSGGGTGIADLSPGVASPGIRGDRMVYGPILLNAQPGARARIANISDTLLKVVVAHEMGHVLGLGHSGQEFALMYYSVGKKQNLALAQDDVDGVTYLYPREELEGHGILGCATLNIGKGGGGKPGGGPDMGAAAEVLGIFLLCGLAVLFQRRRALAG